jgi:hypothetical protein
MTSVDDPQTPTGVRRPRGGGLDREYNTLMYHMNSGGGYGAGGTEGRPTEGALQRKRDLDAQWAELKAELEVALEEEVGAFNREVARMGLEGILLRGGGSG